MNVREFTFRGNAFKVSCRETIPQHPSWFSHVDEESVREAFWHPGPGDLVLDVGAAYGSYALTALAAGAAYAYCWSPQGMPGEESEAQILGESLALNGWQNRAVVYPTGVYDRDGWLNAASQEFHPDEPTQPWPSDVLRVTTLDEWYSREFRRFHFRDEFAKVWAKLDVEGAEVEVLNGGAEMLNWLKPTLMVELHRFKRPNVDAEVLAVLEPLGYRMTACAPYHSVAHATFEPA